MAKNHQPFRGYDQKKHRTRVIERGERPHLESTWPKDFTALLQVMPNPPFPFGHHCIWFLTNVYPRQLIYRPTSTLSTPPLISTLLLLVPSLQACWHQEPTQRPSFTDVLARLTTMYQAVSDASPPPVPSPSNQLTTGLSIFTRSSSMSVSSDKSPRGPEASPRGDHLGGIRFDNNSFYHFVCGLHYTLS